MIQESDCVEHPPSTTGVILPNIKHFKSHRRRGIIWVCDVAKSSTYLNRNDTAGSTEEFLKRFLYISLLVVEVTKGEFIKWTGDGFLAWYDLPLDRDLGELANRVFEAAWHLSLYVNLTQLGVESAAKYQIRHAVTYEKDALVIDLMHSKMRSISRDVLGRNVVLAFRISSMKGEFPSIVTQRELVQSQQYVVKSSFKINFKKLRLSKEDTLKYFKGEKWGTGELYISAKEGKSQRRSLKSLLKSTQRVIEKTENPPDDWKNSMTEHIKIAMRASGENWTKHVQLQVQRFFIEELIPVLKDAAVRLEKLESRKGTQVPG